MTRKVRTVETVMCSSKICLAQFKKDINVISKRRQANIISTHNEDYDKVFADKRIDIMRNTVNILHHVV